MSKTPVWQSELERRARISYRARGQKEPGTIRRFEVLQPMPGQLPDGTQLYTPAPPGEPRVLYAWPEGDSEPGDE